MGIYFTQEDTDEIIDYFDIIDNNYALVYIGQIINNQFVVLENLGRGK